MTGVFLTLWKIYDEMLHDSVMEEAGNVVFVPEGPEYEHVGLYYFGTRKVCKEIKDEYIRIDE